MTTAAVEKAEWAQAQTAQWHRVRDVVRDREFRCGVPYTALDRPPTDNPSVTDYMPLCPVCRGLR